MPSARHATLLLPLLLLACAGVATPTIAPSVQDTEARELTADQQVAQALARLTFGARPGDERRVRTLGVDHWIAEQLDPRRIDDAALERFLAEHYETLDQSPADLIATYPPPQLVRRQARAGDTLLTADDSARIRRARRGAQQVVAELASAKVVRAQLSERQLQEVMVDFWENHFSVFAGKGPERYLLGDYDRSVIRPNALGRFRDLLGAVAHSPAMLYYLDNWESVADSGRTVLGVRCSVSGSGRTGRSGRVCGIPTRAPNTVNRAPVRGRRRGLNENYARELLELHTLGVDGGYTQHDVTEVARALTGWTIREPRRGGGFIFRPELHDAGAKVVLGHRLAANRGIEDGDDVLDIVARHPSTAHFVARKLAVRFVSDTPPPALVERAAGVFQRTDGDIREVLRTIVASPEFFARAAYRAKVKSPFELVASTLRAMNAAPDTTPRTAQLIARLGQPVFGHRDPNGYPETGDAWISTGAILNRINFGMAAAGGRVPGISLARWSEIRALADGDRERQADGVIALLLGGDASPDTREVLLAGENPLAARARSEDSGTSADSTVEDVTEPGMNAGPRRARRASRAFDAPARLDGLSLMVGLALGAPEFQRR